MAPPRAWGYPAAPEVPITRTRSLVVCWLTVALSGPLLACLGAGGPSAADAEALVMQAFSERVQPGPYGSEVLGRGVWYAAPAFNSGCLQSKEWAFRDKSHGGDSPRVSPTYASQDVFQASTERGFCVYVGDDLSLTTHGAMWLDDAWVVDVEVTPARPGGWWDCVDERQKRRGVRVTVAEDGTLALDTEASWLTDTCPSPMTLVNLGRRPGKAPRAKPPRPPTTADAVAAATAFDQALFDHDWAAALDALSCFNLYEKEPYGACSAAELVNVGPVPRGELRKADGPPWSVYAFEAIGADWGRPEKDKDDPTLFHVEVAPKTKKLDRRTISLQWVEGAWKLVGVVQRKAEGLTSVELITDLGRPERRDVFARRLKGENIDLRGDPVE